MSDTKLNEAAAATEEVLEKRTLKEVVLEGLEEKGKGTDSWLW